jgi:hypothetical protein
MMTAETGTTTAAAAAPELLARGRFALTAMPDGSLVLRHATPLCETCQECGCGEQRDPIVIPAMLAGIIRAHGAGQRIGVGQLRALARMAMGGMPGPGGELEEGPAGD